MPPKKAPPAGNKIRIAVDRAFDVLGKPTKPALLFHLKGRGIILENSGTSSLEEIENALEGIFGEGASFIMNLIYSELEKLD